MKLKAKPTKELRAAVAQLLAAQGFELPRGAKLEVDRFECVQEVEVTRMLQADKVVALKGPAYPVKLSISLTAARVNRNSRWRPS